MTLNIPETSIIFKGFCLKQGGEKGRWQKRFFILHDHMLDYFKDDSLSKHLGSIPLIDCNFTTLEEGGGFIIVIHTQAADARRSNYLLNFNVEKERKKWLDLLNLANKIVVFGAPLINSLKADPNKPGKYSTIPYFVKKAVDYIEANGLDSVGVYRQNAGKEIFDTVKQKIDNNERFEIDTLNLATSLVKGYLLSLPEHIFQAKNESELRQLPQTTPEDQKRIFHHIIKTLPIPHYVLLCYLIAHLQKVVNHSEKNKMDVSAVITCLAPSFFWFSESDANTALAQANIQMGICGYLFEHADEFFPENPLMGYHSSGRQSIARLTTEMDPNDPMSLVAPVGSIIQILEEDKGGWAIAVFNNCWGVVHSSCYSKEGITSRDICIGLGSQTKKWEISESLINSMSTKCFDAIQFYEVLQQRLERLRRQAATIK